MIETNKPMDPSDFVPLQPSDFIGESARRIAAMFARKSEAMLAVPGDRMKALLYGAPGTGKTRLVEMFANRIAWHPTAIESVNGRNVTIDLVRRWQEYSHYIPVKGHYVIKIINELDTAPPASQDLLLTYLDESPGGTVFLGTSNLQIMCLSERFETRLQQFKVEAPSTEAIAAFLMKRWEFEKEKALEIATGANRNVRAALLDAQSVLDVQRISV